MAIGSGHRDHDVIVVGLGGMGSAAACHLARRGQKVLGLERFTPAHDLGSSHGGSRIIRLAYFEDPGYVPLLLRAYDLWRQLERDCGRELLLITGGLLLGPPTSPTIAGATRSASEWGLAHDLLDAAEIRRRFPTLNPRDPTVAFYEAIAGLVRPEATVVGQIELATRAGADCHFSERVLHWEASASGGVTVRTSRATYQADRLVICPGAYAADLLAADVPIKVERQVQTWFRPRGGLDAFDPDHHPIWMWEPDEATEVAGFHGFVYGLPALDGPDGGVKMSVVTEPARCAPDSIDRTVHPAELDVVTRHLRQRLAVEPGPVVRADVCMFENSPDHHFVVGFHPQHSQVILAAGFSGHGFKFAPVIGEILADLTIDGTTLHPIGPFDPNRLSGQLAR